MAHPSETTENTGVQYWLMKAEPESRMVKGKDVKFSIEELKALSNQTSPWDGVVRSNLFRLSFALLMPCFREITRPGISCEIA